MGENTRIGWAHHTFNPWEGCTKVSPGCDNCYAEARAARFGTVKWGNHPRRLTSPGNWAKPHKWNRAAVEAGRPARVFCASLADVFDNQVPAAWRVSLWETIRACPALDWMLLTKRPQNIPAMLPADWGDGWSNVWLGTTAENQREANRRIPHLLSVPAVAHFASCEPLIGPLDLYRGGFSFLQSLKSPSGKVYRKLDWIIAGEEKDPGRRPIRMADPAWFRGLRDQCAAAGVAFFMKQMEVDGKVTDDVTQFPADLQVQQFPTPGWVP